MQTLVSIAKEIYCFSNFPEKSNTFFKPISQRFAGSGYQTHVEQMTPIVQQLSKLESEAQSVYLKRIIAKAC